GSACRRLGSTPARGAAAPAPVRVGAGKNDPVGNVPSRPFGGADEYTWSPDGRSLVFAMRVADAGEPWSTNLDLYEYRDGKPLRNLTASNPAAVTGPGVRAGGGPRHCREVEGAGCEADRYRLM